MRIYLEMRVLGQINRDTFEVVFSALFYNMVSAVVALTYLLFNSSQLPLIVLFMVGGADAGIIIFGNFIFTLATDAHLLSADFLQRCLAHCASSQSPERKFWMGMKPLTISAGDFCSFLSKEFLLVIWGDVVISTLIEVLIAF